MSNNTSPPDRNEGASSTVGLIRQARLVWRLWNDSRVPGWVKLIPVAGLLYLLSPIDLIPDLMLPGLGEVDDIVLLMLALKAFVDLSPPGIVREHLDGLLGRRNRPQGSRQEPPDPYLDVPYRVLDPDKEPDDT